MGDSNCDRSVTFPTLNARQLKNKATRVTEISRSLLDVIMVFNPALAKVSGVFEVNISDQFLVFVDIYLKSLRQAPTYVVARSFRNYKAHHFATDIGHIQWDTVIPMDSVDDGLNEFNDLLLVCLVNHPTVRTVKYYTK